MTKSIIENKDLSFKGCVVFFTSSSHTRAEGDLVCKWLITWRQLGVIIMLASQITAAGLMKHKASYRPAFTQCQWQLT